VDKLLTPAELKDALVLECNYTSSSYIENLGNGKFRVTALPMLAQVAPLRGILAEDINGDGNLDLIMTGNEYGNEVFSGRYDAFTGLVMLGNGKGAFEIVPSGISGFRVRGDAKGLVRLSGAGKPLYVATQNRDSILSFSPLAGAMPVFFTPESTDTHAVVTRSDGKKVKVEFYYGGGYFSQSSRKISFGRDVKEAVVHSSVKQPRTVNLALLSDNTP
jgi:hypothetical protein